jgi:hypothetical protein
MGVGEHGTGFGYSAGMVLLPWDCVVLGIPKSVQAKGASIQRWKAEVRAAAMAAWTDGSQPLACEVQIHVTYYHDGTPLDVDNMLKPIQDAQCGVVYEGLGSEPGVAALSALVSDWARAAVPERSAMAGMSHAGERYPVGTW